LILARDLKDFLGSLEEVEYISIVQGNVFAKYQGSLSHKNARTTKKRGIRQTSKKAHPSEAIESTNSGGVSTAV
jgi:hypothetical protein